MATRRYDIGRMLQQQQAISPGFLGGAPQPQAQPQGMLANPAMQQEQPFGSTPGQAALLGGLGGFGQSAMQAGMQGADWKQALGQGLLGAVGAVGPAAMQAQGKQQDLAQQQQQLQQIGMLGEQMGLTPEQQGVLAQMPPDQALGMLGEQAFAPGPDPIAQARLQMDQEKWAAQQQQQAQQGQQPDYDRYRNVPDVGLVDLQTGEVLQAPQAQGQQVDPIAQGRLDLAREEFEFERQLKEREAALKAAGGGEPSFAQKKTIEQNAREIPKLTSTIAQSSARIDVLQKMKALNEQVPFSRIGETLQGAAGLPIVGGALDLTGIYTGEDKAAADQWASYINEYARTSRKEGSGPLSDTDIKLALAEIGGQDISPEGRAGNIDRKIAEETKANDTNQLTAQLVSQNPSMSLAEARSQAQQQLEAQLAGQQQGGGGAAPAPGTVEDGYRYIGGDPADPKSWQQI